MTTIDLSMTPYEFFIDMSYNFEYYDKISNIKCICKDVLLKTLDEIKDIENLCAVANVGIKGVIAGRSIYEGTLDFEKANQLAETLTG